MRGNWGSRLGFILAAAGSAIGLGNIWKFPFVAGNNGGGYFVFFYLISVIIWELEKRRLLSSFIFFSACLK